MKAYKVLMGHKTDEYGYSTHVEIARFFFNKTKAEAFYKSGECTTKKTRITIKFEDGTESIGYTGASFFEKEKKNARPNMVVELVDVVFNRYFFEEIEIED